jgi:hypothetical protein
MELWSHLSNLISIGMLLLSRVQVMPFEVKPRDNVDPERLREIAASCRLQHTCLLFGF